MKLTNRPCQSSHAYAYCGCVSVRVLENFKFKSYKKNSIDSDGRLLSNSQGKYILGRVLVFLWNFYLSIFFSWIRPSAWCVMATTASFFLFTFLPCFLFPLKKKKNHPPPSPWVRFKCFQFAPLCFSFFIMSLSSPNSYISPIFLAVFVFFLLSLILLKIVKKLINEMFFVFLFHVCLSFPVFLYVLQYEL